MLGQGTDSELQNYITSKFNAPSNNIGLSIYVAHKAGGVRYAFIVVHSGAGYYSGTIISYSLHTPIYFIYNYTEFSVWKRIAFES